MSQKKKKFRGNSSYLAWYELLNPASQLLWPTSRETVHLFMEAWVLKQPFLGLCFLFLIPESYLAEKWTCQSLGAVRLFANISTVACQAPLSMGFSRQEYWSALPCPPPGIFPTQGLNPGLLHCRQILYHLSHQGGPYLAEEMMKCRVCFWLLGPSHPVFLSWGDFASQGDIWQFLETFLVVPAGQLLLESIGQRLRVLLNFPQRARKLLQHKMTWPQISVVLRLRNAVPYFNTLEQHLFMIFKNI